MAKTGTYSYSATTGTILEEALRKLGVIEESVSITSAQISDATPTLEMYLKSLGNYGLMVWKVQKVNKTAVAGTASYTPSSTYRYTEITDVQWRDSDGNDSPLTMISREEYSRIPDKDAAGQPTQCWYDKDSVVGSDLLYVWPVPDSSNAGNGEVIVITGTIPIQDADDSSPDGTYDIDLPAEWLEAVAYGMAVRLAPSYGIPLEDRMMLNREYKDILKQTLAFDRETESVYFRPSPRW